MAQDEAKLFRAITAALQAEGGARLLRMLAARAAAAGAPPRWAEGVSARLAGQTAGTDGESYVDLTLHLRLTPDGRVELAASTDGGLEGEDLLQTAARSKDVPEPPLREEELRDRLAEDCLSTSEVAERLRCDKATVTRRIKDGKLIGFPGFNNRLLVPTAQFHPDKPEVLQGIDRILALCEDHREAWSFLTTRLFYGDPDERPIDRLHRANAEGPEAVEACLEELTAAHRSYAFGDHA